MLTRQVSEALQNHWTGYPVADVSLEVSHSEYDEEITEEILSPRTAVCIQTTGFPEAVRYQVAEDLERAGWTSSTTRNHLLVAAKNLAGAGDSPFKSPKALRQEFEYLFGHQAERQAATLVHTLQYHPDMPLILDLTEIGAARTRSFSIRYARYPEVGTAHPFVRSTRLCELDRQGWAVSQVIRKGELAEWKISPKAALKDVAPGTLTMTVMLDREVQTLEFFPGERQIHQTGTGGFSLVDEQGHYSAHEILGKSAVEQQLTKFPAHVASRLKKEEAVVMDVPEELMRRMAPMTAEIGAGSQQATAPDFD